MSERSFYREFRRSTGMTPAQRLVRARLRRAQELLENTAANIEQVAQACGYASAVTFRQRFREAFDVSPSAWQHTFQAASDATPSPRTEALSPGKRSV